MTRSENMARIRSRDTKPEMIIRRGLHACGFRFRLHRRDLPGRPDIVLPRYHAVIQVHGCYWHGHDCLGRSPKTNKSYWGPKISRNRERDALNTSALRAAGWRVLIVWECCMKGAARWDEKELIHAVADWVTSDSEFGEIEGIRAS
ncbi:very short patch repair endonuclease [Actibacterium sp. MT2.3-13A]|uniref:very short patch repair endonuclease n=1 Tax=Actibacterium sp. MT2.3-13A TaxID=2828332 RepID=UPI002011BC63|nr:very short patch repair endonuclease [Actibacterium sp. MT2.3-13A]